MPKVRVGVLRGGPSHEYEVSLNTGKAVLDHLPEQYHGHDILITRDGQWHYNGLPTTPERLARQVDVIFNALHGEYGEDGRVQHVLDDLALPYTGSGPFASAVGMNKRLAKQVFERAGLRVPHGLVLLRQDEPSESALRAFRRISPPWVVKPADRGSSVGLSLVAAYGGLPAALELAWRYSPQALVEEYIAGREATCGVVDEFRGSACYALPPIEIRRPGGSGVWSYNDKYSGATEEVCPGAFTSDEKAAIEDAARRAHIALGLRHYSRTDFIVSPRGLYILETNTLPGMTSESLLPKALAAVGCSYPDFLHHLLALALENKK